MTLLSLHAAAFGAAATVGNYWQPAPDHGCSSAAWAAACARRSRKVAPKHAVCVVSGVGAEESRRGRSRRDRRRGLSLCLQCPVRLRDPGTATLKEFPFQVYLSWWSLACLSSPRRQFQRCCCLPQGHMACPEKEDINPSGKAQLNK